MVKIQKKITFRFKIAISTVKYSELKIKVEKEPFLGMTDHSDFIGDTLNRLLVKN